MMNEEPEKSRKDMAEERKLSGQEADSGRERGPDPEPFAATEADAEKSSAKGAIARAEPEPNKEQDKEPNKEQEQELRDEQGHRYLSPNAINAWRISGAIGSLVYWLIPLGYGALSMSGDTWPEWPSYVLGAFFLTFTILEGTVIPWIRWKRWRYHVDHNEIDLRHGLFVVTRTLIPIKRVQHVDTRQGPVYRQFGLASVTVTTAGDTHEIPALSEPVADDLRRTISEYARIAREDL